MLDTNYMSFNSMINSSELSEQNLSRYFNFGSSNQRIFIEKLVDTRYANSSPVDYKFKCEFPADDFRHNEIKLKLDGTRLIVEAVKQVKKVKSTGSINTVGTTTNESGFFTKDSEHYKRELDLPPFLDLATLNCYLETFHKSESVLVVEAYVNRSSELYTQLDSAHNKPVTPRIKPRLLCRENSDNNSSDCLRFKFDLKGYHADNINLSIRNKSILMIKASKLVIDPASGLSKTEEFNHEINLPSNAEIFNIRNSYDEDEGLLRLEIPFTKTGQHDQANSDDTRSVRSSVKSQTGVMNKGEKYLELTFDLYDFKFDDIRVESDNILVVSACREHGTDRAYIRKYALPTWVKSHDIIVNQERRQVNNKWKNLLILQLPIVS